MLDLNKENSKSWKILKHYGVTPDNLTVGGYLDLEGTQITELPDNLTVGGYLDLRGTQITELPDNLTVGGGLDLEGTQITELPDNLTVGGYLYLGGTQITDTSMVNRDASFISWDDKYIKVDGIFIEVVHKRGNVWKVRKSNGTSDFYLVTDGNGKYAHGDTIKEARMDLMFKVSNRDKSDFEHLTLDSEISFQEAIESYRIITGACGAGVKDFVRSNEIEERPYKVSEIIKLTENSYGGGSYASFFNR